MRSRWWPAGLAVITGGLGLLLKSACASSGWGGSADTYSRLCYSDLGPLYYLRGFADGVMPYLQEFEGRYLEYPVLIGFWMWLTAVLVAALGLGLSGFVYLTWAASLALAGYTAQVLGRMDRQRALWFALSPALLLTLGINWDALAVLAAVLALHWWQRRRPAWAGLAIGVGVAAKLYPGLLLVPLLADAIRTRRWRHFGITALAAIGIWTAINLPVYLANADGWWEFYRFSQTRGIDFGSLWLAISYLSGFTVEVTTANTIGLIAVAVAALALLLLRRQVDLFTAAFVIVAVFALFNKVYSPQYWLWLTPLAALANVKLRHFLIWNAAEAGYFVAVWLFLLHGVEPNADLALPAPGYALFVIGHWFATAALVVIALRRSMARRSLSGRLGR